MTLNRRTLLKSSIPTRVGSVALGSTMEATAIEQLFTRWEKAQAEYERLADELDEMLDHEKEAGISNGQSVREREEQVVDPAYTAMSNIEDEIMNEPIEGPRDLPMKVVITLRV